MNPAIDLQIENLN